MWICRDYDFKDLQYNCWGNAIDTLNKVRENDKEEELMSLLETDCFSEIPNITMVNDLLWFEDKWIFEMLGIDTDSDDDDDEDEEDEVDGEPCPFTGKLCTTFECEECDIKRR